MPEQHITVKLSLSLLPDGRARARIDEAPTGASRGPGTDFDLPTPPPEGYPKFLKACGIEGGAGAAKLATLGKELFKKVFADAVGEAFSAARGFAQARDSFLRLAVNAVSAELLQLPWEYLHDGKGYLLQKPKTHIVRVLDELPEQMAPFRPFTRMLVAVANPAKMPRFDPDPHFKTLRDRLAAMRVDILEVFPAQRDNLLRAIDHETFDAFYFLGHGALDAADGGVVYLEAPDGNPDPLPATVLAQRLNVAKRPVYFAYFNSCDTGTVDGQSTFSGVAQRVLADGGVPAVVAQQAPVKAKESMLVTETFLNFICRGESPEMAVGISRSAANGIGWGLPVLYTHLRGAEEFERNRLACLLSADREKSSFGLVLPTFGMGVRLDGHGPITIPARGTYSLPAETPVTVTVTPPDTFVYPGVSYASDDAEAASDIRSLLLRVATPNAVASHPTIDSPNVTHWFLFGSGSSRYVTTVLRTYSPRFEFRYGKDEWILDELDADGRVIEPTNRVPVPYHLGQRDFANQDDIGIIEKVTDTQYSGKVYFIIAGMGSRATRGCGWYLAHQWERLLADYGGRDFGVVLKFPGGMPFSAAEHVRHRAETSGG